MRFNLILGAGAVVGGWLVYLATTKGRQKNGRPPPPPSSTSSAVHIVGSSVNIPDMSETLKVKVAISEEAQQDPRLLAVAYDNMAQKFSAAGFNLAAISAMRQYFNNLDGEGDADPLLYSHFPSPLPPRAVRLCLVFFQKANAELAALVHQAATEVLSALPPSTKTHLNDPHHYHITVYMPSQPHTLRPSPIVPGNFLPPTLTPEELFDQAKPTDYEEEVAIMKREAAATPPPTFCVHRLLMADSGTLLLCSTDTSGVMSGLRRRLRESFPGGPPRQSTIFHASVARVLTPAQLDKEAISRVQTVCDRWSDRLRGKQFRVEALHYVAETKFTTVEGPNVRLPFNGVE